MAVLYCKYDVNINNKRTFTMVEPSKYFKCYNIDTVYIQGGTKMYRAIWQDKVLAQSDKTIEIEGNQYFPKEDVNMEFFEKSSYHTTCPWKGLAHYYNVKVDSMKNKNAAWYYPNPKPAAKEITDYVAFWKGVKVKKE